MLVIGKSVDYGDRTVVGEIDYVLMVEGPDHDAVDHARKDVGGIVDGLAPADLDVVVGKEEGHAAELVHADLEGYPCPRGGLREDHAQGLAVKIVVLDALLGLVLHVRGDVKEVIELLNAYVFVKIYVMLHFRISLI